MPSTKVQRAGHCATGIVEFKFEKRFLLEEEGIFLLFFDHNELLLRKSKMMQFLKDDLVVYSYKFDVDN